MDLVYKQYYIAGVLYFLHKTLDTALKLSPELGAGYKPRKVKQIYFLVKQSRRSVAVRDFKGETLGYCSLSDARFTYKTRVVLGSPR